MTNGNSAERERFEKWIGQKRPDESGMEQYSWDDCWAAWEARAAMSVDDDKDALGWTWERRHSNGGYTRKFCTSEFEARELAKDGESLSIPDLVYPFFARADGGKGEAVYQVQTGDCWLDMTQEQYERHSKTRPTRVLYTAPQAECAPRADADTANIYERFDAWMKGPHARVQTMLDAFAAGASNERADAEKDATLTPEDLAKLLEETATCTEDLNQPLNFDWMLAFARAILAKSKEK